MLYLKCTAKLLLILSCLFTGCSTQKKEDGEPPTIQIPVTSFYTGNPNITTSPLGGICMMGGRTENDNAMRWFLNRAQGGDVLVMRASGSDGYNDYFYSELGVNINSVETLVFNALTEDASIIDKINQAEAIWFAGGDQGNYVAYWKDNAIEDALQSAIDRNVVIGGTSAGMAILGDYVWTGDAIVTDFLDVPYLHNTLTDTHFSERNRMDRLQDFIGQTGAKGIAADEYTAICVDETGLARVFGTDGEGDNAFFITPELQIETVTGSANGNNSFNLANW
ncbi:Cyanophycinase [Croceitalea dokdonensis DOKDO 023]|uniref:Cyanophycinase n=1 Tax=Croceitalea dokdonensis DOKDO 023 TaxID=1300341 RepID=A0A0P7AWZ8_9FLAO|nr:cyanophycinase [Croceitalea dokdonensis]KPM30859.1 Cyanophycinase [Croceitalea dokdonensis DOKDO 023]